MGAECCWPDGWWRAAGRAWPTLRAYEIRRLCATNAGNCQQLPLAACQLLGAGVFLQSRTGSQCRFIAPSRAHMRNPCDTVCCCLLCLSRPMPGRYIPVGLLEVVPQVMSWRPPAYCTRSKLEGLLSSESAADWVKISEMFLGPAPAGFTFVPKHKSNAYTLTADALARMVASTAGTGGADVPADDGEEGEENG